ncbi:MAG: hypothetical protein AB1758_35775, partial [Candidatus Eremiobacterota bacterium]
MPAPDNAETPPAPGKADTPAPAENAETPGGPPAPTPSPEQAESPDPTATPMVVAQEEPPPPEEPPEPKPQLPKLFAMDEDDRVPTECWSRRTHPNGEYYGGCEEALVAYSNDDQVFFSTTYTNVGNPGQEEIVWDWLSPNPANNGTARGTAASCRFLYTSVGTDPADFDSRSTLEITVWDRRHPEGKVTRTINTPTHLPELELWAGITARDVGVWTLTQTRNGNPTTETFTVQDPPAGVGEWSRWASPVDSQDVSSSVVAYTNDNWLLRNKTFPFADPNAPQTIAWDWISSDPELNKNQRDAYLSVVAKYRRVAGGQYRVRVRVFDANFPGGRVWKEEVGPGTLSQYTLSYGQGLPAYGAWTFRERVNEDPPEEDPIQVRSLVASVSAPSSFFIDNGPLTCTIRVESFPLTWIPSSLDWSLAIRPVGDSGLGAPVREFTGTVTGNTNNPITIRQEWDGTDSLGQQVDLASRWVPEVNVATGAGMGGRPRHVASR